ncbi:MAG: ASKHA domain-containing protein [Bacillota bacterium]|nr:ASKHA domain-containing protein [Bacillota bacterium]
MNQRRYTLHILPEGLELQAYEGENLRSLLEAAGLIKRRDKRTDRFRLERGSISPAERPEREAAVFSPAQRTEGWFLASQRRVQGDATLHHGPPEEPLPVDQPAEGYGLAFDLGSGTVAAGLVDLGSMNIPQLSACSNLQLRFAPRLEDRQKKAASPEGRQQLRKLLLEDMQYLLRKLCSRTGVNPEQIKALSCAGSSLMLDLLDPAPEAGRERELRSFRCAALGLNRVSPDAELLLLPAVSRDLGADVVASCLAADLLHKKDQPRITLLLDLGMSGEIIGAGRGRMLATSIPELPFEGQGIHCGMSALTGAITQVELGKRLVVKTVRDGRPLGVSGSGLLSAARVMLESGLLDAEGRISPPAPADSESPSFLRSSINGRELLLSPADKNFPQDIFINQDDILTLQMAKGSIYAACQAVLNALGAGPEQISEILLAESYRAHLQPRDFLRLGLLPAVDPERVLSIGNAAWQGAFLCLNSRHYLEEAQRVAAEIQLLDLTTDPVYAAQFIQGMNFGEQKISSPGKNRRFLGSR